MTISRKKQFFSKKYLDKIRHLFFEKNLQKIDYSDTMNA